LLQHRLEFVHVADLVRQPMHHYHLHLVINTHGLLGVIALDESILRLHESPVRIGEIALFTVAGRAGGKYLVESGGSSRGLGHLIEEKQ